MALYNYNINERGGGSLTDPNQMNRTRNTNEFTNNPTVPVINGSDPNKGAMSNMRGVYQDARFQRYLDIQKAKQQAANIPSKPAGYAYNTHPAFQSQPQAVTAGKPFEGYQGNWGVGTNPGFNIIDGVKVANPFGFSMDELRWVLSSDPQNALKLLNGLRARGAAGQNDNIFHQAQNYYWYGGNGPENMADIQMLKSKIAGEEGRARGDKTLTEMNPQLFGFKDEAEARAYEEERARKAFTDQVMGV